MKLTSYSFKIWAVMLIFDLNSISKTDIKTYRKNQGVRYSLAQMENISVSIYCSVISFRL